MIRDQSNLLINLSSLSASFQMLGVFLNVFVFSSRVTLSLSYRGGGGGTRNVWHSLDALIDFPLGSDSFLPTVFGAVGGTGEAGFHVVYCFSTGKKMIILAIMTNEIFRFHFFSPDTESDTWALGIGRYQRDFIYISSLAFFTLWSPGVLLNSAKTWSTHLSSECEN